MRKVAGVLHGSMLSDECCFVVTVCCILLACRKLRLANWKNFAQELFHKVLSGSVVLCGKYSETSFAPWLLRLVWRHEPVRNGSLWKSCATRWRKSWCQQGRLGASKMCFYSNLYFCYKLYVRRMVRSPCKMFFYRERLRRVLRKKAAVILHLHTLTSADLHLHTFTSADLHLHTFTSADLHLHTFTPADLDLHTLTTADLHLHTLTPADLHLHTLTPADRHLHTLTPADLDLHTLTSADLHLHTLTSADLHLLTLTPADLHLHTLTPADRHLHTLTPADLHLHTLTLSHLQIYIFSPSHLQIYIFTPSHLQI